MRTFFALLFTLAAASWSLAQSCGTGLAPLIINIVPDNYPQETSWAVHDAAGNLLASGGSVGDTLCLPASGCFAFSIYDSYGDGICCGYGLGSYDVLWNGLNVASGGAFLNEEVTWINCPQGASCNNPWPADTGMHALTGSGWYEFTPDTVGTYVITTCLTGNTCNTEIWVYDQCNPLVLATGVAGALMYSNTSANCTAQAELTMVMDTSQTYLIRLNGGTGCSFDWQLHFQGPVVGCMDPLACNYDPLATVSSGNCLYYPDPNCPPGPDLSIVQSDFENSLYLDTVTADNCAVQENCLTGYGDRLVLRFDTHIRNDGATDYFIGNPASQPSQFSFNNCHGHAHYEGYAEYVLYQTNGYSLPIGFKNGFCVLDLLCQGGGTAKYSCANQGITAGCGDIYGAYLDCQWIDITDVPDGDYILANKVNWDQSPDALGRLETDFTNNWAQVCITLSTDALGNRSFTKDPNCPVYTDCLGVPYGNARIDCKGVCGGPALEGDLDTNQVLTTTDFYDYLQGILAGNLAPSPCTDLTNDGLINVWDLVMETECLAHGGTGVSCQFPKGLENPFQQVEYRLNNFDPANYTVDLEVRNPDGDLAGVQVDLTGAEVQAVYPLISPNPAAMAFYHHPDGRIIGLSPSGQKVSKSLTWQPLARIQLGAPSAVQLCLANPAYAVNAAFENVNSTADPGCFITGLSLDEEDWQAVVKVWPNPAHDQVTVSGPDGLEVTGVSDLSGRRMGVEIRAEKAGASINLQTLAPGLYLIHLELNGSRHVRKVVVN